MSTNHVYNYGNAVITGMVLMLGVGIFAVAHSETILTTGNKTVILSPSAKIEAETKAAVDAKTRQRAAEKDAAMHEKLSTEYDEKAQTTSSTIDAIGNKAKSVGQDAAAAWDRTRADYHEGTAKAHVDNLNEAVSDSVKTGVGIKVK